MTRHRSLLRSLLPLVALALMAPAARAEDGGLPDHVEQEKIKVRMVADATAVVPGQSVRVGIVFETAPDWHVYWKNPGETGLPTRVTFGAPDGYAFGELAWPVPVRFVDKLGGVSFGYEGSVLIAATAQVPADAAEGTSVALTADTSWLVCHENCITGKAALGLVLPVQSGDPAALRSADHERFEAAARRVPAAAPAGLVVAQRLDREGVRLGEEFAVTVTVHDPAGKPLSLAEAAPESLLPNCGKGLKVTRVEVATDLPDLPAGAVALRVHGVASKTAAQASEVIESALRLVYDGNEIVVDVPLSVKRLAGEVAAAPGANAPDPAGSAKAAAGVAAAARATSVDELCQDLLTEAPAAGEGEGEGGDGGPSSFLLALLFAFVGGLVLNVMPCVLPVLSLKVMSLVEQNGSDRKVIWRHGLAYTAGVLASFGVMAAILVSLKVTTWGFQMQDPLFVSVFAAIVFAMALSLFGVYEITLPGANRIDATVRHSHGYTSSFAYGIFAVLLGTPCTAPLLGPAMAYAFTQPPLELTVMLLMVGFGLAFPFLLLAAFPQWQRVLPKPGPWLETFKKIMGFLLVGTTVYLIYAMSGQVSRAALVGYLAILSVVALALWVYGHWGGFMRTTPVRMLGIVSAIGLVVGAVNLFGSLEPPPQHKGTLEIGGITWHDFDQVDVKEAAAAGNTVFIDFTAEWCATCKVNEGTAIYTDEVRNAFAVLNIMPVKADFTVANPEIARWLQEFKEPSVPLYVVLPAGRPEGAIKLPTLLSTQDVLRGVCRGGPSRITTASR